MAYFEDLRTVQTWCCCVGLRIGCIFTCLISTIVYLLLAFSHMLEHKPATCWITVVVVVSTNTLLAVGAIQENHKVLKVYLWFAFWIWIVKVLMVLGILMSTKIYSGGDLGYFLWYLIILSTDVYFWVCINSYYISLLNEEEVLEPADCKI